MLRPPQPYKGHVTTAPVAEGALRYHDGGLGPPFLRARGRVRRTMARGLGHHAAALQPVARATV